MNIAGLAIDRRAVSMTQRRSAADSYAGGERVPGAVTSAPIKAVIQPMPGRELRDLPEGIREEAGWLLWSRVAIVNDDVIVHAGRSYRVLKVWPRDEGGFVRAALGMLPA